MLSAFGSVVFCVFPKTFYGDDIFPSKQKVIFFPLLPCKHLKEFPALVYRSWIPIMLWPGSLWTDPTCLPGPGGTTSALLQSHLATSQVRGVRGPPTESGPESRPWLGCGKDVRFNQASGLLCFIANPPLQVKQNGGRVDATGLLRGSEPPADAVGLMNISMTAPSLPPRGCWTGTLPVSIATEMERGLLLAL